MKFVQQDWKFTQQVLKCVQQVGPETYKNYHRKLMIVKMVENKKEYSASILYAALRLYLFSLLPVRKKPRLFRSRTAFLEFFSVVTFLNIFPIFHLKQHKKEHFSSWKTGENIGNIMILKHSKKAVRLPKSCGLTKCRGFQILAYILVWRSSYY